MYEKFFYLNEKPFHVTPDPKFLYLSRKHREAIELLTFGIIEKKGFILLTGEVGTGKTTLCRALLEKLPKRTESALILNPLLSELELLRTITSDFGIMVAGSTAKDHVDALNKFLLEVASKGGTSVVIIDEAQNLSRQALEMVRLLSNLETEKEKLLQIILVGQPELDERLSSQNLRQLNQRIIVRYKLTPLDVDETSAYITNRLFVAGGKGAVEFTREAVALIHTESSGIPRKINIICDRALTASFIEGKRKVGEAEAKRAVDDLGKEGYLSHDVRRFPLYTRYAPHLAVSLFLVAFVIGMLWGPMVLP